MIALLKELLFFLFGYDEHRSMSPSSRKHCLPSWVHYLLVSRKTLLKAWTNPTVSPVTTVKRDLQSLLYLEKLNTMAKNCALTKRFFTHWRAFTEYSFYTSEIVHLMSFFSFYWIVCKSEILPIRWTNISFPLLIHWLDLTSHFPLLTQTYPPQVPPTVAMFIYLYIFSVAHRWLCR